MRGNNGTIGPKQNTSSSVSTGIFNSIDQQINKGTGLWALSDNAPYSVFFDGTGDFLTVSGTDQLSLNADFTVACWIYLTSAPADYQMIISNVSVANNAYIAIRASYIEVLGMSSVLQVSKNVLVENKWFYLAVTRSGSTVTVWLNGKSIGSGTRTGTFALGSSTFNTYIGRWGGGATQYNFPGYIANLMVIKGTSIYNSTFAVPSTKPSTSVSGTSLIACSGATFADGSNNNLTISANGQTAVSSSIAPLIPASIKYNGTNQYQNVPAGWQTSDPNRLPGNFTIELFVRFHSVSITQYIFTYNGGNDPNLRSNGTGSFLWGGFAGLNLSAGSSFQIDTWYHLALTRSGTTVRSFKDGVLVASGTSSSVVENPNSTGINIASLSPTVGFAFAGYISNFRIIKGECLYTSDFTRPSATLPNTANTSTLINQYHATEVDFSVNALSVTQSPGMTKSITIVPF